MPPRKGHSAASTSKGATTTRKKAAQLQKKAAAREPELRGLLPALKSYSGVVLSSLTLSTLLFSQSTVITHGDLAWTSRHIDSWWIVGLLLASRTAEITAAWVLDYDGLDTTWLVLLTHLPTYNLLLNFYGIRPSTIITVAAITIISSAAPVFYFRKTSAAHDISSALKSSIVQDKLTTIYTTVLAASIYAVTLYFSFATWLPPFLVTHFDGLPDIRAAYAGPRGFVSMFISLLLAGYAARDFIFVNSVRLPRETDPENEYEERPDELLAVSLYRKYWVALPENTKAVVSRTGVLAIMTLMTTVVQVEGTIIGAELAGAVGWGSVWSLATAIIGKAFWWIQAVK